MDPRSPVARPQPPPSRAPERAARALLPRVRLHFVRARALERDAERHRGGRGPALAARDALPRGHAAVRVHGADAGRAVLRSAHRAAAAARTPPAARHPQREARLPLA